MTAVDPSTIRMAEPSNASQYLTEKKIEAKEEEAARTTTTTTTTKRVGELQFNKQTTTNKIFVSTLISR